MGRGAGDVKLKAGRDTYTLRLSMNAICEIEGELGQSFSVVSASLNDPAKASFRLARVLLWGALLEHHEGMTIKGAGDVMGKATMPKVWAAIGEALTAAFPVQEGEAVEAGDASGE